MTNKESLVQKITNIADGFRTSRSLTDQLSLDEMAELAAVPITSGENKLAQLVDGTLTEITAEDLEGVTKIKQYAFYYNTTLQGISFPNTITQIERSAFSYSNITNIVIPNHISIQGAISVFQDCRQLESIVLPENPNNTALPASCFGYCLKLDNVIVPDNFTVLEESSFQNCRGLTNITLSRYLTKIYSYAFYDCIALNTLTIPSTVNQISSYSLRCGSSVNTTTFTFLGTTPPSISTSTFDTSAINKIIVPAGYGDTYKNATNWANFADFIEEAAV